MTFGFMTWIHVGLSTGFVPKPIEALALMAVIAAAWLASVKAEGWAFVAAAVGIGGTVGSIFWELYPRVMISTTSAAYNLTVNNTASPPYTLKVMTVVAVIFFPIVLVYQAWGYHIFRKRLSVPKVGDADVDAAAAADAGEVPAGIRSSFFRDLLAFSYLAETSLAPILTLSKLLSIATHPDRTLLVMAPLLL